MKYATLRNITTRKPVIDNSSDRRLRTTLFAPPNPSRKGEGGLRTKGQFKRSLPGKPLISVITVVFNGQKTLEKTILSVLNQTHDNLEYIIIDGGSADDTPDIIKKYQHALDYWISEPDNGIYHAMNKGIDFCSGDWINFMNAGDYFAEKNIIYAIFQEQMTTQESAFIYGDAVYRYPGFEKKKKALPLSQAWKYMPFCHQSFFLRANIQKKKKFNTAFSVAADYSLLFDIIIKEKLSSKYIPLVISSYLVNGYSDISRILSVKEQKLINYEYRKNLKAILYFNYLLVNHLFRRVLKKILPDSLVQYIQKKQ